jgi:hypothetical protein
MDVVKPFFPCNVLAGRSAILYFCVRRGRAFKPDEIGKNYIMTASTEPTVVFKLRCRPEVKVCTKWTQNEKVVSDSVHVSSPKSLPWNLVLLVCTERLNTTLTSHKNVNWYRFPYQCVRRRIWGFHGPENGGSMLLRNACIQPKYYTAQQPKSSPSKCMRRSYRYRIVLLLWEWASHLKVQHQGGCKQNTLPLENFYPSRKYFGLVKKLGAEEV